MLYICWLWPINDQHNINCPSWPTWKKGNNYMIVFYSLHYSMCIMIQLVGRPRDRSGSLCNSCGNEKDILSHNLKVSRLKNRRTLPGRGEGCVPYFCPSTYVLVLDWPLSLSLWLEENIHFQNRTIYKYYATRCKEVSSLLTPFLPSYKVAVRVLLHSVYRSICICRLHSFGNDYSAHHGMLGFGSMPSFPMFVQYQLPLTHKM